MASVLAWWYPFYWIYLNLSITMYHVDLSLGPGDDSPPPPRTRMTASYLFNTIRTDKGMLVNILALLSAVLIGAQALLGSRRRRLGSKAFVRLPLWAFYTISFPVVSYTIGLVQSVQASNMPDSQLLWAIVLLLLLGSVNGMSAFSRKDIEQSKGMLANHVVQTLLVLWLLFSRSDVSNRWVLLAYFLLCWIYSIIRMAQRMTALRMASSAHGLVRSATVVADYMKDIVEDKEHDPKHMDKCKYLVHGEEKDFKPPSKVGPPYLSRVGSKVVTVDKIWKHEGKLLCSGDKWDSQSALKDTCLSFALFNLLKRRFCGDLDIAEAGDPKTMEFVVDGLLAGGHERAFRLVEVELSFLYDFFYTKYPVLVSTNILLGVVRFFVLLGFFKVLLVNLIMDPIRSELGYHFPEYNFIYFNNLLVVIMILSIDILQGLATGYSNWALVQFVCDYVVHTGDGKRQRWWKRGCGIRRALMKLVAAWRWRKSAHCWDNKLGQYSLLKSYNYNPSKTGWNALSWLSMRMMEPTGQGRLQETDVPLTAKVKEAVLHSLKETRGLPSVGRSLKKSARHLQLHWACDGLPTHTHTVLVWHIATTMCDVLDNDKRDGDDHRLVATTLSGYCAYLLAFVPDMLPDNSYKAMQILDAVVEEARRAKLGDIKDMFELKKLEKPSSIQVVHGTPPTTLFFIKSMLSTCFIKGRRSYRSTSPNGAVGEMPLAFTGGTPTTVPFPAGADNGYKAIPMQALDGGVVNDEAQTYIRGGDTMDTSKRRDMTKPSSSQVQDEQRSPEPEEIKDAPILILGARLGRQLRCVDQPQQRWELLANFWAELLLFLAPSNNADVHAEHLATGGEFITHLWALLTHAGIVERPLHASPA